MIGRREERWEVGILCFQDTLRIGKWKRWRVCSENFNLWFCIVMWKMFWVGRLVRMIHFLLDLSTAPSHMPLVNLFLGALFGDLGLPWELAWNIILTIDQLKRRGWNMPNRCYLCKMEEETSDHLIIFCKKATTL